MKKRELSNLIGELHSRIEQWEKGNLVVIDRLTSWGYTLEELKTERESLLNLYRKRWGYLEKRKKSLLVSI